MLLLITINALSIGLISHFNIISNATSLPIIIYNVPSRTGFNILPSTCLELSKIDSIVGIKEASSDISQLAQIANLCKDDLAIYTGCDDQIVPSLSLGAIGVISVLSNIAPKFTCELVNSFFEGDTTTAKNMQLESLDLINLLFCEVNPIPVKAALNIIGFNFGDPRLPLTPLSDENTKKLELLLK